MKQKIGDWTIESIDDLNYILYTEYEIKTGKLAGTIGRRSITYHPTIESAVMKLARIEANKADDLRGFISAFKILVVELKNIVGDA